MSVVVIKMVNGEEVIAKMVNQTDVTIVVDRPRVINITQDHTGKMQGGLMPYLISDPERKNVSLSRNSIVTSFPADKELSDSYLQMTSGLILG